MTEPRVELEAPLGELLRDEGLDAPSLERVRRRVAATRRVAPAPSRRVAMVAAAVVLVAGGVYLVWPGDRSGGPLERASGGALGVIAGPTRLSDGSMIVPQGDVPIEVVDNTGTRLVLVQGHGRVGYRVTPGGPRRWSIDAGAATVDVVGTRFVVERTEEAVRVSVERGEVRVRGEAVQGGLRSVARGESLEVPTGAGPEPPDRPRPPGDTADLGTPETLARPASAPAQEPAPAGPEAAPGQSQPPRWLALARRSDHAGAFDLLGAEGVARETRAARSVEALLLLANVARAGQRPELAVAPLETIVERHPGHPRAAWAALTLGRLHLDSLDRPAEAVSALERAIDLGLSGRLRETALARLVEAHRRAGQPERALIVAAQYRSEFPDGRYLAPIDDDPR